MLDRAMGNATAMDERAFTKLVEYWMMWRP
jgi:hypothetical protein